MRKVLCFKDAKILESCSKGSNAMTFLMIKNSQKFYRKYANKEEIENLKLQYNWLKDNNEKIKVAEVLDYNESNEFFYYDMRFFEDSKNFFDYINENVAEDSFNIIKNILNDLNKNLYSQNIKNKDTDSLERYIHEKVEKNIELIKSDDKIKELLKYDTLIINGAEYKNLNYILKYLSKDNLKEIFKDDTITNIHGDLTIENIIYRSNNYYLIDPNVINYHLSDNLDYSKLLQSIHGKYEYIQNIDRYSVLESKINYDVSKESSVYDKLLVLYDNYLNKRFSKDKVRSIYFHEIIHWIRLLIYKIKKDDRNKIIFFSQFIIISNDIISRFKEEE